MGKNLTEDSIWFPRRLGEAAGCRLVKLVGGPWDHTYGYITKLYKVFGGAGPMVEVGRRLRHPETVVKSSRWLPAGLSRYDEDLEDVKAGDAMEWLLTRAIRDRYAFWANYTLIQGELVDTHEKLLGHVSESGKLEVDDEIRRAVESSRISVEDGQGLRKRLTALVQDGAFREDWRYLEKRYQDVFWRGRFYPEPPTEDRLADWRELHGMPGSRRPRADREQRMWEDAQEFLNCYDLDAVCGGVPFVDIFDIACRWTSHDVRPLMVGLEVSAFLPVRELRKAVEMAVGRFTAAQRILDRGRRRGDRLLLLDRDRRIYQEFERLREQGMPAWKAYRAAGESEYLSEHTAKKIVLRERRAQRLEP